MSWNHYNNSYDAFWRQASGSSQATANPSSDLKNESKQARTPPTEGISDGQMSVALDKDLMELIDNISQELSRTSTTSTSRTATTVSPGNSYLNLDFGQGPNITGQRFNSYGSQTMPSRTAKSGNGGSSLFLGEFDVIEESPNEHISSVGYKSQKSAPNGFIAPRPPVYKGPRSPQTAIPTSPNSVPLSKSTLVDDPLPQVLHALDDEDDDRIVVVRRITKLGFKSNRTIKTKFNDLGWEVKNVVLLPSRSRSVFSPEGGNTSPGSSLSHARPSSMGFVVFKTKQAALDCLERGTISIEGVDVLVQPFVRQYKPTSPISFQSTS